MREEGGGKRRGERGSEGGGGRRREKEGQGGGEGEEKEQVAEEDECLHS